MSELTETELKATVDAGRFKLAEHERVQYTVTVESGITRQQIVNPGFWSHVAAKLRPYDRIEVRCDDGSFFADLIVLGADRTWARVFVLGWYNLTTKDVSISKADAQAAVEEVTKPQYTVQHKGPHLMWCVIRAADGERVREKEPTKAEAQKWLDDYLKVTT